MRILAIDPGPTTGFCLWTKPEGQNPLYDVWQEELQTTPNHRYGGPHDNLWNVLSTVSFDVLLGERFEFRKDKPREKIDIRAGEYVGVCKLYAQQNPYIKLVMQGASVIGKSAFWSDDNEKVKQLGLYNPKAAPHGMDALRHVLYYVTFTLNDKTLLMGLK